MLRLSKQAARFVELLRGKDLRQIERGLETLQVEPLAGKPLVAELKGYWSLRVGHYRIIYLVKADELTVDVIRIQHRRDVYEKLGRSL